VGKVLTGNLRREGMERRPEGPTQGRKHLLVEEDTRGEHMGQKNTRTLLLSGGEHRRGEAGERRMGKLD